MTRPLVFTLFLSLPWTPKYHQTKNRLKCKCFLWYAKHTENFKPGWITMRLTWSNLVSFFTFFLPICEWLTGVLSDNYHAQAGSRSQKRMHTQRRCKNSTIDLCSFTAHFPHGLAKRRRLTIKNFHVAASPRKFCFELLASFFAPISANTAVPNYSPLSSLDVHRRLLKGEGRERDRVQA